MNTETSHLSGPVKPTHKLIDEERHDYILNVLPPLYISYVDGVKVKNGIACSEPYTHGKNAVVLTVCYRVEDKYYEVDCEIFKADGTPIWDTYDHCYSSNNIATTWRKS